MKRTGFMKMMAMMLIAGMVVASCGSEDDDDDDTTNPTGGGSTKGTLTARPNAANVVVTEDNAEVVSGEVQSVAMAAFGKAMQTISYTKPAEVQYGGKLNGTINGDQGGTATVSGTFTYSNDYTHVDYAFTCVYSDYSDDGQLFLAGQVTYDITTSLSAPMNTSYDISGGLRFNGSYVGEQTFSYIMNYYGETSLSTVQYSSTVKSGGQTFTYNYNYPE